MSLSLAVRDLLHRGGRLTIAYSVVCLGLTLLSVSYAQEAALTVTIETSPPAHEIRPDLDDVKVTLHVLLHGQPLSNGHLQVRVTAPPSPSILSTDFPIVEGTPLLALASDLQAGAWSFDYLFPIRGTYTFDLTVSPVLGGPTFPVTTWRQTLHLAENPAEVRNIWLLVVGLFLLGGVAGVLFARSAAAREGLHATALVSLFLFASLVLPGSVAVSRAAETVSGSHGVEGEAGWRLTVRPTPAQATVGQLVRFDIALSKTDSVPAKADTARITMAMHHVEDDKMVFQTTLYTRQGQASEQFQFFDGAPHTVTVTAVPGSAEVHAPLQVKFDMDVAGIHPPMAVKLRTLALLLGVMVVGMVAGFFLPSRRAG